MKKLLIALLLASATTTASANFDFFGGDNNGEWKMGPNGAYWEEGSSWPQWTPMYWMEEFMDNVGGNDNNFSGMMPFGNNNSMMPFANNNSYNTAMPYGGFPQQPMMPYGGQAMMPAMPVAPIAMPVRPQAVAPAVAPPAAVVTQ